jgi:hypothetical protein
VSGAHALGLVRCGETGSPGYAAQSPQPVDTQTSGSGTVIDVGICGVESRRTFWPDALIPALNPRDGFEQGTNHRPSGIPGNNALSVEGSSLKPLMIQANKSVRLGLLLLASTSF